MNNQPVCEECQANVSRDEVLVSIAETNYILCAACIEEDECVGMTDKRR